MNLFSITDLPHFPTNLTVVGVWFSLIGRIIFLVDLIMCSHKIQFGL
jgi:hypothetical protein